MNTVPFFICPSTPGEMPSDYALYFGTTPIGNKGPIVLPRTDYVPLPAWFTCSLRWYGKFHHSKWNDGITNTESKPSVKLAEVSDGLSNTICIAELAGKQNIYFRRKHSCIIGHGRHGPC